jgi:RNA-directed DNA polymerase
VLDIWFEETVKLRLKGRGYLIRFADDFVMIFSLESDAKRVMEGLPKRFGRYGLRLHPDKTRMLQFKRPHNSEGNDPTPPGGESLTFWDLPIIGEKPEMGNG